MVLGVKLVGHGGQKQFSPCLKQQDPTLSYLVYNINTLISTQFVYIMPLRLNDFVPGDQVNIKLHVKILKCLGQFYQTALE